MGNGMMKKILIVDDDSINCLLAKHALAGEYQAETVNSGKEALGYLKSEIPDLILMDIEMPEMDGKEVVKEIKACEKWNRIPVIFLTADASPNTEAECLQCGADDFITKPFVADVMKSRVAKVLEAHELRKDLESELEQKTIKSYTDALTGLKNRAYLEKELAKLLEEGCGGTLFMTDLDNFKSMNDTYGHMVGDAVLQNFADALKAYASEEDILCRLGGDEFVAFFKDLTDQNKASQKASGIIKTFSEKMGAMGYAGIVSVSVGAKITDGKDSFDTLYSDADETLYYVKENGKNSFYFWSDEEEMQGVIPEEIDTDAGLDDIHRMIFDTQDENKGAFNVEYNEFKTIYDFAMRSVARKDTQVQTLLFTLSTLNSKDKNIAADKYMEILKRIVVASLRSVDTGTKYSSSQYIVLLMDTDEQNGRMVAKRIVDNFYRNEQIADSGVKLTYDIQSLVPAK